MCHCNRCRKYTGSTFNAGFRIRQEDFKLVSGKELISRYETPTRRLAELREEPRPSGPNRVSRTSGGDAFPLG